MAIIPVILVIMISVQRLNMDTSWIFTIGEKRFLVDPWLTGPEVDGFRWFNEQHHVQDPVAPSDLPGYDYILISQSYEDHCHLPTLRELSAGKTYVATGKAAVKIKKKISGANVTVIPDSLSSKPVDCDGVKIYALHPGRKVDPIYYAVILEYNGEAVFYASHGFTLSQDLAENLKKRFNFQLLISTFTLFRLPAFMGGDVNPGTDNAISLVKALKPAYVIGTHDEQKTGSGLVSKLAKVTYPDFSSISMPGDTRLIELNDYKICTFD